MLTEFEAVCVMYCIMGTVPRKCIAKDMHCVSLYLYSLGTYNTHPTTSISLPIITTQQQRECVWVHVCVRHDMLTNTKSTNHAILLVWCHITMVSTNYWLLVMSLSLCVPLPPKLALRHTHTHMQTDGQMPSN